MPTPDEDYNWPSLPYDGEEYRIEFSRAKAVMPGMIPPVCVKAGGCTDRHRCATYGGCVWGDQKMHGVPTPEDDVLRWRLHGPCTPQCNSECDGACSYIHGALWRERQAIKLAARMRRDHERAMRSALYGASMSGPMYWLIGIGLGFAVCVGVLCINYFGG